MSAETNEEMVELLDRLRALCELESVNYFIAITNTEGDDYHIGTDLDELDEFVPHPPANPVKVLSRGEDFVNAVRHIFDMEQTI